jgi:UDP-N-acetylmuramoylalanine--D-glutamate ligase
MDSSTHACGGDPASPVVPGIASRAGFEGRRVLVCGAGLAGSSAARALLLRGATVAVTDTRETDSVAELVAAGASFAIGLESVPEAVELVVASPGWRPHHPVLSAAMTRAVPIIGEIELAWRLRSPDGAPWLALTGTNGKTTTVRMLEAILRGAGLTATAVGNVGVSIIDAVLAEAVVDVLAVEMSSFQLNWTLTFAPAAAAVLNLAPDHLDWHPSMQHYAQSKARIWRGGVAIANLDDPGVVSLLDARMADRSAPPVQRVEFTMGEPAPGQLGVVDEWLVDRAFGDGVELVAANDVRPSGAHNVANALAASALARSFGVSPKAVAAGLGAFVPDPHRNQFVARVGGVDYVDDSKATNPHAAHASLSSYSHIVWIAGGQLKGAPVEELVAAVSNRLVGVVLLGSDRDRIHAALTRHAPDVPVIDVALTDHGAMSGVVEAAAVLAHAGDTVLLAPAAASYDMFASYAARGEAFAAAVASLPQLPDAR